MKMALASSSVKIFTAPKSRPFPNIERLFSGPPRPSSLVMPRHPSAASIVAFSRRRHQNSAISSSSSKKKKVSWNYYNLIWSFTYAFQLILLHYLQFSLVIAYKVLNFLVLIAQIPRNYIQIKAGLSFNSPFSVLVEKIVSGGCKAGGR